MYDKEKNYTCVQRTKYSFDFFRDIVQKVGKKYNIVKEMKKREDRTGGAQKERSYKKKFNLLHAARSDTIKDEVL